MRGLYSGPPGITAKIMRHKPPVSPMDVAFLVPEASKYGRARELRRLIHKFDVDVMLRILLWQAVLGAALAALFWGFYGPVAGYSALLGSLTCVVPNAFLALRLAVPRRDPGAQALIRAAYIGELGKLALTVLMFGTVFALVRPLAAAPLFAGFIAAQPVTFAGFLMRDTVKEQEARHTNGE